MIELSDVTLISVDTTDNLEGTLNGIYTSMSGINFGAVKLITTKEQIKRNTDLKEEGITLEEPVREIKNYNDYNYYVIYCLHNHVETSHCLLVQPDGFVLFPDKWDDEWLKYDYIGAPWPLVKDSYIDPFGNQHQVGNGGFSLRSKKLLKVPTKVEVPWETNNSDFYWMPPGVVNYHEDGNICVHNRHIFVEQGCEFAPADVAVRFSQENRIPECEGIIPFGFHYRLPPGVELS
tara:strand:+ start:3891 stop:4592 length:702 start_codon:yes stop_codon:yes gene_type:complete